MHVSLCIGTSIGCSAATFTAKRMAVPTCFGIGTYQTTSLPISPVVNIVIQLSPVPSGSRYLHLTSYLHLYNLPNLVDQIGIDLLPLPTLTGHQAPMPSPPRPLQLSRSRKRWSYTLCETGRRKSPRVASSIISIRAGNQRGRYVIGQVLNVRKHY